MKYEKEEIEEATTKLKEILKQADYKVYTILRHVSRSGMSRNISTLAILNGEIINLDYYISRVLSGFVVRDKSHDGLKISGCGMDMGFHLVYSLGGRLYGYGKGSEAEKLNIVTYRNGDKNPETDGGYVLTKKHHWL